MVKVALGVQVMSDTIIDWDEDFTIEIKIAVYSTKGEFIRQLDATSLSDVTIDLVMEDVKEELEKRG